MKRLWQRRTTLAFVVLALATAFAIYGDHHNAERARVADQRGIARQRASDRRNTEQARRELAAQTRQTLLDGCKRGNVLRLTLQDMILNAIPTTRQYVKEGTLTPAQGRRAETQARNAARRIGPIDCDRAYPPLSAGS